MLKRLFLVLAFAGLLSPAYAAGTIPFSFYPQVDLQGRVMPGCKFYTIVAGTVSTPQNAYQDSALTLPLPNPQTCDASGRLPQMFLADGQIKVRLTTSTGVNVLTADNVLVIGPSGGGGGGGTVDPTTVLSTGDTKCKYGTGILTGFVRRNGRTIGSATSGATERANADTQALFEYLWSADPNLVVSTGRGASANADWVANKTIALPDQRGRVIAGADDMGNTSAARLSPALSTQSTTLGGVGGAPNYILTQGNLPATSYNLAGTPAVITVTANSPFLNTPNGIFAGFFNQAGVYAAGLPSSFSTPPVSTGNYTPAGTIGPLGSGGAFNTVQPTIVETCYAKL